LVLVLLLIGWKSGASFLNQSRSVVNAKPITFRHSNENRSKNISNENKGRNNIIKSNNDKTAKTATLNRNNKSNNNNKYAR